MKRRRWGLALAASICASLVVFGIPSLILTILSKNEFISNPVSRNKGVKQYMEIKDKEKSKRSNKAPRTALISVLVLIIFICFILTTDAIAKTPV